MIDWGGYRLVTVDGDGTLWNFELTSRRALQRTADQFAARLGGIGPAVERLNSGNTPTAAR